MKDFVKKIIGGLGTGLGFGIALILIFYVSSAFLVQKMAGEAYSAAEEEMSESFEQYDSDAGLVIKSHRERKIEFGTEILAEVENAGESEWSTVVLEVEFFDEDGKFVDECSEYAREEIKPGEVNNVKIKCGGCKDSPLAAYSTYTIEIVDATSF